MKTRFFDIGVISIIIGTVVAMVGLVFGAIIKWWAVHQIFISCVNVNWVSVLGLILGISSLVLSFLTMLARLKK